MKIEPVSPDVAIEDQRERQYYTGVMEYLKFMINEMEKKITIGHQMGYEADRIVRESNSARYASGGKYDPFDQGLIHANMLLSAKQGAIDEASRRIRNYKESLTDPYFGRVDYGSSDSALTRAYVGYRDIGDYVYDWRSTTAGKMYQNAQQHLAADDVFIALKRQIKTEGGYGGYSDEINQYYRIGSWRKGSQDNSTSEGIITGDEHLIRLLEEYRSKKQIHDIVKSIQQNQYRIITEVPEKNILVNGCAGSGKSMVMYHRLSYLAYNYSDLMKADRIFAITPSPIFSEDVKPLLHKLELDEIFNGTYTQIIKSLILRYQRKRGILNPYLFFPYTKPNSETIEQNNSAIGQKLCKEIDTIKDEEFLSFCLDQANNVLRKYGFKDFSGCVSDQDFFRRLDENYHDERFLRKISVDQNILLPKDDPRRFYGKEIFTNNTFEDVVTVITRQFEKGENKKRHSILNHYFKLLQETFSAQPQKCETGTVTDLWTFFDRGEPLAALATLTHVERLIRSVLDYKKNYRVSEENTHLELYKFYYAVHFIHNSNDFFCNVTEERACALEYLAKKHGAISNEKTFFFIDEFQNFNIMRLAGLKCAFPNAIFNLYGDFDQRLTPYGISSVDELRPLGDWTPFEIRENYRNATEITEYINVALNKQMLPIGLSGSVMEVPAEHCEYKKMGRTVIIFPNSVLLAQFLSKHKKSNDFHRVLDQDTRWDDEKINLITVKQAKGLEFETVYVHATGMSGNERYVAYTRALENLVVVTSGKDTPSEGTQDKTKTTLVQTTAGADEILEIKRLQSQYNELCRSHRTEEDLLLQKIQELQNRIFERIIGAE